jgi:hypothetical protein
MMTRMSLRRALQIALAASDRTLAALAIADLLVDESRILLRALHGGTAVPEMIVHYTHTLADVSARVEALRKAGC